eukprot:s123_g27.t1
MARRRKKDRRRRRPRDSQREAERPTKRAREAKAKAEASGVVISDSDSSSSVAGDHRALGSGGASSSRPITVFSANPGRSLDPHASQRLQEQAAQNLLRRALPPDAFVALASRLERPYMQSASSRVAEPRQMVVPSIPSVPQDVEADSSGNRASRPSPGEGLAVRQRTWPAGANPGSLYASDSVACLAPAAESDVVGVGLSAPKAQEAARVPNPGSVVDLTDEEAPLGVTEQPASLLPGRSGECLGPARLSYCPERQDYEIRWDTSEPLAVHGRPLHSDRTTRLFLGDVDLAYLGPPDETRAPATPPTIMESMRHRARLQDHAGVALRLAAASGSSGDGTPPLAFTPDGDVSDFMARWTFSNMWEDPRWFFVHSGSSERDFKQGGVLILVAKHIVDPGSLRFVEPLPGRILWVHFTHRGRPVDLLNFYQHTWRNSERVAQLRHRALDLLTKSIQTISLRSVLIAAGDFNAQCVHQMPHVGPTVMQHAHWAQDSGEFQSFIEGNDLVALNTFSSLPKSHDCFTYAWGSQKSQLDYIFLRRAHATGPSKQARVHYTFPLIGIRDGGRHYPVCTQVPIAWQPWQRSRGQPPPPQIDRHAIADTLAGVPDASVSAFRTAVQSLMQTPGLTLDAMQHQVHHLAVEHFPARRAPEAIKSCQDVQLQGYAARMWSHFHAYRKLRSPSSGATLSVLFRAWHHRALYHSMRAAAKKRSAEFRKLRRDRLFATARTAATSGNLREFYKVVRLLAPHGSKRRFQLCQGGAPLPPERELAIMQKHFEEQFASHNASLATPEPWECDGPVLVTVAEVQWHLDKLPARKAGAPSTSPGAVWRLCSDLVSPFIAQQLSDSWGQGRKCVPHLWTTATLALLLKAGKNGSEPKHFRPIGLLDALGKSCISMVLHKIKSDLEACVRTAPQFSYIAGRSAEDALRRVFYHCAEARRLREAHVRNPHQRFAGLRMPSWQGGVQICLDLASAFDTVPHSLVREALCEAGVAEGPASLLLAWLSSCSYDLHLSGLSASIPARRGVKQGCPASPLLFAACTVLLTRRIDLRLGCPWTSEHLTMFADASLFRTVVEFEHECERIGALRKAARLRFSLGRS